jgi:hypothetical protein
MRFFIFLLVFLGNLAVRGGSIPVSIFLGLLAVIIFSLVARKLARQTRNLPRPGQKRTPKVVDGDIGPYLAHVLEQGDHEAVVSCITQAIPATWRARDGILMLAEEHCRLQRSIRIATRAGVPMPEDTADFSARQTQLIADRARRMAFVYQHGLMNGRIEASLAKLVRGSAELTRQSTMLRAELAESTGNPMWGAEDEREIRRKLERMTNTLRAMSSDLLTDEFDRLAPASEVPAGKARA